MGGQSCHPIASLACLPPPLLQVEASDLSASLLSGRYEFDMRQLRVTLHRAAGVQQLGGTLLALPFLHAPQALVRWVRCAQAAAGAPAAVVLP